MILYKYFPPARLDVLKDKRIRFTQPADFNDPFEFRPRIEAAATDELLHRSIADNFEQLLDEELDKYGAMLGDLRRGAVKTALVAQKASFVDLLRLLDPAFIRVASPLLDRILNQNVGVLCLSEIRDSLLMWGHYTDNHRGFVIGFDPTHRFFSKRKTDQDEFGFLRRVDYQRERPSVILSDTSSPAWFQTKSTDWAYEREWRIARVLSEAEYRTDTTQFPICLFEFPSECVLEIILGMRSTPEFSSEVHSLRSHFPRATFFRAREHPSEYGLLVEEVNTSAASEDDRTPEA